MRDRDKYDVDAAEEVPISARNHPNFLTFEKVHTLHPHNGAHDRFEKQAKGVSIMIRVIAESYLKGRVVLLWLLLLSSVAAEMKLKQLHVITRHGSRYALTKTQTLVEGTGEGTLTPLGQKQMFDLGVWLRKFYESFSLFDVYDPSKVHLQSSAFERTVTSANSLALGFFPQSARDPASMSLLSVIAANVPVYTTDNKNDVTIRAYDKCGSFLNYLDDLYSSEEWKALEKDNSALLKRLAGIASFEEYVDSNTGRFPLTEVWNAFDAIHVAKTECDSEGSVFCQYLQNPSVKDALDDDEWFALQSLAHRAELLKYGSNIAGRYVGGNLLLQIVDRMQKTPGGQASSADFEKFYLYSAHYPTILGLLAALNDESIDVEVIPNYASALIFELYENDVDGQRSVQILYKFGDGDQNTFPLGSSACSGTAMCPLTTVSDLVSDLSLKTWCQNCGNVDADVCLADLLESRVSCSTGMEIPLVVGWFSGVLCSLVVLALTLFGQKMRCCYVKSSTAEEKSSTAEEDTVSLGSLA
jgi:hypothetical protein